MKQIDILREEVNNECFNNVSNADNTIGHLGYRCLFSVSTYKSLKDIHKEKSELIQYKEIDNEIENIILVGLGRT